MKPVISSQSAVIVVAIALNLVAVSELSAQWVNTSGGYCNITKTFVASGNSILAGTEGEGIYRSENMGLNWDTSSTGCRNVYIRAFASCGTGLMAGSWNGIFASVDGGHIWVPAHNGVNNTNVYALADAGGSVFAGTAGGVYSTNNFGSSWSECNNGLTYTYVRALAVLFNSTEGNRIFAGTEHGVFRSTNNGSSWSPAYTGISSRAVYALALIGNTLFAGTYNGGVYRSENFGDSWTAVNTGLTNSYIIAFAESRTGTGDTILFAGSQSGGVFMSSNKGGSWTDVSTGLTNRSIHSLLAYNGYLFAGTNGNGIWRRPLSQMVAVDEDPSVKLPSTFVLHQNYPNPFNPSTTIRFSVGTYGRASVRVYDLLGREVATLVDETKSPGEYSVDWNADGVAAGIYFCRLYAAGISAVRKLVLVR